MNSEWCKSLELNNDQNNNESRNTYREKALNKIARTFTKWFKDNPKLLSQVQEEATKLESEAHVKATCKEDYVAKIQQKMRLIHESYFYGVIQNTLGSNQQQIMNNMTDEQSAYCNQSPRQTIPTPHLDALTTYETQRKLLMDKYDESRCLNSPLLMRLQEVTKDIKVGLMIDFLTWKESDLKYLSNITLHENLNAIAQFVDWYYEEDSSSQKQAPQFFHEQISRNHLQITPLVVEEVLRNPEMNAIISQSHAANTSSSIFCAPNLVDMQNVLNEDPQVNTYTFGVTTIEREVKVQNTSINMGIPEKLVSATSSYRCDQNNLPLKSLMLPFERLTQVIMSIPSEILERSMDDISSAFLEMDELPNYAFQNESKLSTSDYHQETETNTSYNHNSNMERLWKAANHDLVVAEVIDINRRLIGTWVEVAPGSGFDLDKMGTIVRCLYMPIAFSEELRIRFVSIVPLSILSIEFLVPPQYPESSPTILDISTLPDGCSLEGEALLGRAREMFCRSVEVHNSIAEMAKAWDDCGKKTFTDLAIRLEKNPSLTSMVSIEELLQSDS